MPKFAEPTAVAANFAPGLSRRAALLSGATWFAAVGMGSPAALAAEPAVGKPRVQLAGRIIRAISVHPNRDEELLVGIKGEAGDGLVFRSDDLAASWQPMNGGRPLSPESDDVQCITAFPDGGTALEPIASPVILAGTWQNGLFRSTDKGETFSLVKALPFEDIRSLAVSRRQPGLVYASVVNEGVAVSRDHGATWVLPHRQRQQKPPFELAWSLWLEDEQRLWACVQEGGLWLSRDGAKTWRRVLDTGTDHAWVMVPVPGSAKRWLAVSDENKSRLFHSTDAGATWREQKLKLPPLIWTLAVDPQAPQRLLMGCRDHGVWVLDASGFKPWAQTPPLQEIGHLVNTAGVLVVASWGNGLAVYPRA